METVKRGYFTSLEGGMHWWEEKSLRALEKKLIQFAEGGKETK